MTDNVKIIDVNKIGKPEGGKFKNIFESFKENPLSLAKVAGVLIVIGAIIGLLSDSGGGDNTPTVTTVTKDAPPAPIINPKFGTSYSSGGGLDKLYDDLGGNDPLKNGKLDATINVDTDKYSCKFNVKYEGENKKMIECLSGCYNEDQNSEFCEGYIYNDQIDGGKRLSNLYDDAGGNENARSGQYNAIINVSSGEDYDTKADLSCGFSVEYVGNNKRSVSCTAGWCDENDKNRDKCKPYGYESRNKHGTKGDTLLDDTYVNRRGVLEDDPCDKCNKDHTEECVDGQCKCQDGWKGEKCGVKEPEPAPNPSTPCTGNDCGEGKICDTESNNCVECLTDRDCNDDEKECVSHVCKKKGSGSEPSEPSDPEKTVEGKDVVDTLAYILFYILLLIYWSKINKATPLIIIAFCVFSIFVLNRWWAYTINTISTILYVVAIIYIYYPGNCQGIQKNNYEKIATSGILFVYLGMFYNVSETSLPGYYYLLGLALLGFILLAIIYSKFKN